jgi:hypothetical protein
LQVTSLDESLPLTEFDWTVPTVAVFGSLGHGACYGGWDPSHPHGAIRWIAIAMGGHVPIRRHPYDQPNRLRQRQRRRASRRAITSPWPTPSCSATPSATAWHGKVRAASVKGKNCEYLLQWRLHVRPAAAVPVFPEVWRGRFGLFLCHSLLLALAFHPPGWGLVSDSGTMACLELLW